MSSSSGRRLLSRVVYSGSTSEYISLMLSPELFRESEQDLYHMIHHHVMQFGVVPDQSTVEDHPGLEDALVVAPEPVAFYLKEVERRYLHTTLTKMVTSAHDLLMSKKAEEAFDTVTKQLSAMHSFKGRHHLFDFRDAAEVIVQEYLSALSGGPAASLMFGWPTIDGMTGGLRSGDFCTYTGRPASGKAQPLSSKVLLVSGFTTMGEIKVGDKLASVDGAPSVVTGVFPQGVKPVFRVTFQDGRSTEAADEHLWEVWHRAWPQPRVITTVQLAALLSKRRYHKRLTVRMYSGEYGKDLPVPFDPYVLGLLLGDGCFRGNSPTFSTEDPELVSALVQGLSPLGLSVKHTDRCNYRICGDVPGTPNPLKEYLADMGLWGSKSEDKFLPSWVFRASRPQRLAVLQGLMDSDGTADKNGGSSFSTSSPQLSKDFQRLVWSLGGRAKTTQKETTGLLSYRSHVVFGDREQAFRLCRKRSRVAGGRSTHTNTRLGVSSVEFVRSEECQCIMVDHPEHLYITDDYVVTHNTFQLLYTALTAWNSGGVPLFISMEMNSTIIMQRLAAMKVGVNLTKLLTAQMSTQKFNHLKTGLQAIGTAEHPFWVVDGNLATKGEDIIMLVNQLNPSAAFVDGAYLLRHSNPRLNKWDRMTENAELLKQGVATDCGVPVVASYQLNREVTKKKKEDKKGVEDIYGTDAIGQLSTVALGLFEEDSVETLQSREITVLKGRNGEIGKFRINWNFDDMDFTEIVAPDDEGQAQEAQFMQFAG